MLHAILKENKRVVGYYTLIDEAKKATINNSDADQLVHVAIKSSNLQQLGQRLDKFLAEIKKANLEAFDPQVIVTADKKSAMAYIAILSGTDWRLKQMVSDIASRHFGSQYLKDLFS